MKQSFTFAQLAMAGFIFFVRSLFGPRNSGATVTPEQEPPPLTMAGNAVLDEFFAAEREQPLCATVAMCASWTALCDADWQHYAAFRIGYVLGTSRAAQSLGPDQ